MLAMSGRVKSQLGLFTSGNRGRVCTHPGATHIRTGPIDDSNSSALRIRSHKDSFSDRLTLYLVTTFGGGIRQFKYLGKSLRQGVIAVN